MKGYLNNPNSTANAITKDGWFKSGDVGVRDDEGYYYIVDRKKELIKYKGCVCLPSISYLIDRAFLSCVVSQIGSLGSKFHLLILKLSF